MSQLLSRIVASFSGLRVVVIGEAMLDSYIDGSTDRLCREAPVPIVRLTGRRDAPGGGANTAVNLAALGARVDFLSVVGDDAEAGLLRQGLGALGVGTDHVLADPTRRTLSKSRIVAASQLIARLDQGDTGPVSPAAEAELIRRLEALVPRADAVVISDYGYGILTPRLIARLAGFRRERPGLVMVADSKDLAAYRDVSLSAVKPNYDEAVRLVGANPSPPSGRAEAVVGWGERLLERTGARLAAVTLDADGALMLERGRPSYRTYARPMPHSRAAGAGDTFLATLALGLAAGAETPAAADLASAACAIVVAREGTAACSARSLLDRVAGDRKPSGDVADLVRRLRARREAGERIVLTNGCFDILHRGHITYLSQAKALGDALVVGVNSDAGIRRLKGPERPINALDDRIEVLAALGCVDHVVAFDEDTPCELVRAVRPDVFVKGGDYTIDRLPEAAVVRAYGGEVRILPFVADRSTTHLIERIRAVDGWAEAGVAAPGVGRHEVAS
ncbi:D-glycero-beta-D-manno-heptose 1-phosphate adenylyltransferase [Tundrisphaera sp. TA3]|uniref:D-glycero-beta-D-manno-heptose 1-phosphate adenylyltransferase n=1 Tax=Tundrisphaera sp. TA3 TaxID=3435775 RepID=UPI003EC01084